jgi:regulator of nonsense transcripts 3
MATPQLLSRKANGHASTGASQKSASDNALKQPRGKAPVEGEKVTVRRLPPGITVEEFLTILGDEWKVGKGKVAWFDFRNGKVSSE